MLPRLDHPAVAELDDDDLAVQERRPAVAPGVGQLEDDRALTVVQDVKGRSSGMTFGWSARRR